MRIAVFGASGRTGRLVVAKALASGHEVSAVTRRAEPVAEGARVVRADVRDPAAVAAAVDGADVVLSTIAPPLRHHLARSTTLYSVSGRNLARAVAGRLVVVSSAGVLDGDPSHPLLYRSVLKPLLLDRALYRDMRVMEQEIRDGGTPWMIVRASGLTDGPATGRYRIGLGRLPDGGHRLSRADLADFLVEQLPETGYLGQLPTLAY